MIKFTLPFVFVLFLLGMSINIVEVTWKGKLKEAFPDPNAYSSFMGNFSTATGSVLNNWCIESFIPYLPSTITISYVPCLALCCLYSMVTLVMMLLGRTIFQKFGWGVAALITPITLLITGVMFFSLIIFNGAYRSDFYDLYIYL